ncbi:acyl-phosphate glycerol 3-phosphate acyltransferase [Lysinibacillus sp. CD3-6]|uniref:acyl-phosphate glycerol 3-phosphate acyltransferase n=1 Tax=Lysinibacillus sp. CD3-6 TaxID=2892541 RepID=UPI0011685E00|nr:acyl-phosphate glycerol 3-phosphate acyltransferase [Lysinibacillus sp. CD3-6]UED78645.1 acyl-phosphate glycerol 3-phosphate acyltransferase [Lysinibacillus sp. CD3-6]
MDQQKMPPAVLRLLVIFPNVLSYLLLGGLIIYVTSNYDLLKSTESLKVWLIFIAVLAPAAAFTTFRIVKKIRAGHM